MCKTGILGHVRKKIADTRRMRPLENPLSSEFPGVIITAAQHLRYLPGTVSASLYIGFLSSQKSVSVLFQIQRVSGSDSLVLG